MSCCPPNSHAYLASDYSEVGQCLVLPGGVEVYTSGELAPGKNGILMIPDIWGWHGGRTRNFADQFAEAGYYTVVPKFLVPPLEGGTDGDGLPPDFDFGTRFKDFGPYISTITWIEIIKPKVDAAIKHMKEGGINKIASVGFCWGGVMVAHTLDEYASDVVCGVVPHPSFGLEDMVYGGKSLSLIQAVKRPMLLCPAGNDPDNVKEGGELILALKANNPDSETSMDFQDQQHGFSLRGDVKDPNIKAKVELFLEKAYAFISKYL